MDDVAFKPAWWLQNPHLQTMWATLFRFSKPDNLEIVRERFELPDGDFIDIDWAGEGGGPIVIILHGLEGSIESPYAQGMLASLKSYGWRGAFMHFRCCSGERNRLLRTYHSGETGDVASFIQGLKEREPNTPLAAIGFSLGGNVLLKWLGETGEQNPLTAAIVVSVPFDLKKSVERLSQGFSQVYQSYLVRILHKKMLWKFRGKSSPVIIPPLSQLHSLRDFDENVTAPLHGFKNADDYYEQSSSLQYLKSIHVPTLILQAKDDPFYSEKFLPTSEDLSPAVQMELTEKGGHVGFVTGTFPWRPKYWLEQRIPLFLRQYIQ